MPTRVHSLLGNDEKARLRHLAEALERETGAEIAALVLPHVDDLEAFATAYFNHVGIGKREHNNGVLILVVVDRRQVRIEVGHGLETVVTKSAADRIITHIMVPEFRAARYGEGVLRGAEAIAALVRGAHRPSPPPSTPAAGR
jgi:uncharacterized protein